MKYWLTLLTLTLLPFSPPLAAVERCAVEQVNKVPQPPGRWISQSDWLAPENLRFGMQSAEGFMSLVKIKGSAEPEVLRPAPRLLDLDKIKAGDPLDEQPRDIGFLLDSRLYADGFLVLRNGRVLSEQYWHGLSAQQPRLLLGASRPLLSLMGAMAVAQGKLAGDKSVVRYVPALAAQTGLRKLSIQRLLEANSQFEWSAQEISDWQAASGWKSGATESDLRAWLSQPDRWERNFAEEIPSLTDVGPEGDLLVWALAESYRAPLAQVFCEDILSKLRPENTVFWLTDQHGTELSGGLALSLRDFARFGQMLIDARNSRNRSKIPNWFIETLTSSAGGRKTNAAELTGLSNGSESRYGFVHLGGKPNRIAILGPYGNSLYVDFDRRLVIALFASYPRSHSGGMLATLEQVWERIDLATQPVVKR
jgi:CubicO group peptidase (beta-lactamase class C family)